MSPLVLIPAEPGILSRVATTVETEGFSVIIRSLRLRAAMARSNAAYEIDATRMCSGDPELNPRVKDFLAEALALETAATELLRLKGGEEVPIYTEIKADL